MRAIKALPTFPEDGQIEIVEAGRGSFKAKLAFYSALAGAFAGVGSFGKDIVELLRQPDTELARCVAWTMVDDGVTKAGIRCAGDFEVLKSQMPAVLRLVASRAEVSGQDVNGDAATAAKLSATLNQANSATGGEHNGDANRRIKNHSSEPFKAPIQHLTQKPEKAGTSASKIRSRVEDEEANDENARLVSLVGQLDESGGKYPFEFMSRNGDSFFAREADDFDDMVALGQEVFVEATLKHTDEGPMLYIHRLRIID